MARTSATMSAATRNRNSTAISAAMSITTGARGSGKMPWNGRTSASVRLYRPATRGWLALAPASFSVNRRNSRTSRTVKRSVTTRVTATTGSFAIVVAGPTFTFVAGVVAGTVLSTCSIRSTRWVGGWWSGCGFSFLIAMPAPGAGVVPSGIRSPADGRGGVPVRDTPARALRRDRPAGGRVLRELPRVRGGRPHRVPPRAGGRVRGPHGPGARLHHRRGVGPVPRPSPVRRRVRRPGPGGDDPPRLVGVRVRDRPGGRPPVRRCLHRSGDPGAAEPEGRADPRAAARGAGGGLMDLSLPEELVMLQRTIRGFVEERLSPHEREIEYRDLIPRALIDEMAGAGIFGVGFAEDVGGQGFGKLGYCVMVEQLARADAAPSDVVGAAVRP